jgi:hypothetical protein
VLTRRGTGATFTLARRCGCGGSPGPDGECSACKAKRVAKQPAEGQKAGSSLVAETLRSPGRPLEASTRVAMEERFDHDFSRVRIHTDEAAAESARAVDATAYAIGRDVVFGAGRYAPGTQAGRTLLAHELTHVVQQGAGDARGVASVPVTAPDDASEREARHAAAIDAGGLAPRLTTGSTLAVVRQAGDAGTAATYPPGPAARKVGLQDDDASVSRMISTDDPEFLRDYIDYNIANADFWDTPYASTDRKYRAFWVNYTDGRALEFNLDEIPVRYEIKQHPGYIGARLAFKPTMYFKRGGFIYPDLLGEGSVPRLIDVATTVKANHLRREQYLEIATLTFQFAMILTAYAAPPELPSVRGGGGRPPPRRFGGKGGGGSGEVPPVEPVPKAGTGSKKMTPVPETGTPGSRKGSVATAVERERMAPKPSLSQAQQAIADELVTQHPGLSPRVAAEASVGAERGAGAGGAGADVILLGGGGREVSVHAGGFTLEGVGAHLIEEAGQAGTTQVYLQINTQGATRTGLLQMMPRLQRGYVDLDGVFVKIFGPNGEAWWSGVFRFTGG